MIPQPAVGQCLPHGNPCTNTSCNTRPRPLTQHRVHDYLTINVFRRDNECLSPVPLARHNQPLVQPVCCVRWWRQPLWRDRQSKRCHRNSSEFRLLILPLTRIPVNCFPLAAYVVFMSIMLLFGTIVCNVVLKKSKKYRAKNERKKIKEE